MVPYGSENFKTLLLLQIADESFHTFPEAFFSGRKHNTSRPMDGMPNHFDSLVLKEENVFSLSSQVLMRSRILRENGRYIPKEVTP